MKKIETKIDELLKILDEDSRIIKLKKVKEKLLKNEELLTKIQKLQQLDIYSNEYKELKKELFENKDFVEFKHLENEINLLIMEINQKLKPLTNERGCNYENN